MTVVRQMKRRRVLSTLGACAVSWPASIGAQQPAKKYRIGILTPAAQQWSAAEADALRQTLESLRYKVGDNLTIELRDADGQLQRLPQLAAELVAARVDAIVAVTTPATRAAMSATRTIPIIMASVGEPVATNLVASLRQPGANVTGVSIQSGEIAAKRLQLMKELVPAAERIAVLMHPDDPITAPQIHDVTAAAARIGVSATFLPVRERGDVDRAFAELVAWRAQAVLRLAGQSQVVTQPTIELAMRHRLPTMLVLKSDVRAGALMSYDADRVDSARRVAHYVDRMLRGGNPAVTPIEQPTKFELAINLRTAKALGLTVPMALLAAADEVIE